LEKSPKTEKAPKRKLTLSAHQKLLKKKKERGGSQGGEGETIWPQNVPGVHAWERGLKKKKKKSADGGGMPSAGQTWKKGGVCERGVSGKLGLLLPNGDAQEARRWKEATLVGNAA